MLRRVLISTVPMGLLLAACASTTTTPTTPVTMTLAQKIYADGTAALAAVQAALTAYTTGSSTNPAIVSSVQSYITQAQGLLNQLQAAITSGLTAVTTLFTNGGFNSSTVATLLQTALTILLTVAPALAATPHGAEALTSNIAAAQEAVNRLAGDK